MIFLWVWVWFDMLFFANKFSLFRSLVYPSGDRFSHYWIDKCFHSITSFPQCHVFFVLATLKLILAIGQNFPFLWLSDAKFTCPCCNNWLQHFEALHWRFVAISLSPCVRITWELATSVFAIIAHNWNTYEIGWSLNCLTTAPATRLEPKLSLTFSTKMLTLWMDTLILRDCWPSMQ